MQTVHLKETVRYVIEGGGAVGADDALPQIIDIRREVRARNSGQGSLFIKGESSSSALSASDLAHQRLKSLGGMSPSDTAAERKIKLRAIFDLRDALISEGMKLWSPEQISSTIEDLRHHG